MKRRLLWINLGLTVLLIAGVAEWIRQWRAAQERYSIFEQDGEPAAEVASFPGPPEPARTRPDAYMPIVERLLFSPDRNAVVVVEAPEPEVIERPDLPRLVGIVDLGRGPVALMAADGNKDAQPVAPGEKIGPFTFVGVSGETITLEWRGQRIEALQAELAGRPQAPASRSQAQSSTQSSASTQQSASLNSGGSDGRETPGGKYNIGPEVQGVSGVFRADPRDKSPAGTEYKGYVKRVRQTPFGQQAWWEKQGSSKE